MQTTLGKGVNGAYHNEYSSLSYLQKVSTCYGYFHEYITIFYKSRYYPTPRETIYSFSYLNLVLHDKILELVVHESSRVLTRYNHNFFL